MNPNLCVDCEANRTYSKIDGKPVCVSCSNQRYYKDLISGIRVELKIDLREYKQGTIEELRFVLAKNKNP